LLPLAEIFRDKGYLPIKRIFDPALIADLHAEYERQFGELSALEGRSSVFKNVGERRLMLPVKLIGPFLDPALYANRHLTALLGALLGGDFLIDNFTCVSALAGAGDQRLHADHPDLFPENAGLRERLGPYSITVAVPLVDLTPQTGTTCVFPGSHVAPRGEPALPYVARGGCFLMDYRLRHHGTANASPGQRPIVYIVYSRPWFTDAANFKRWPRINIAADDLASIPEAHRPLFRRLAVKGAVDRTEAELLGPGS
jgi:ectoine hydroxylase-related dioxygenase (phytanoyl-CoA dioxygenase family)